MLGYIQKDHGMPHYSNLSHNVSPDELQEGRRSYEDVRVDFIDGRIALNKANLIKHMYTFWTRCGLALLDLLLSACVLATAVLLLR